MTASFPVSNSKWRHPEMYLTCKLTDLWILICKTTQTTPLVELSCQTIPLVDFYFKCCEKAPNSWRFIILLSSFDTICVLNSWLHDAVWRQWIGWSMSLPKTMLSHSQLEKNLSEIEKGYKRLKMNLKKSSANTFCIVPVYITLILPWDGAPPRKGLPGGELPQNGVVPQVVIAWATCWVTPWVVVMMAPCCKLIREA